MNILDKVKESVLWLYKSNNISESNLKNEALKRNINPNRIIFCDRIKLDDHLNRHSIGDLFLDTFNYSAGLTASLALFSNMPLLTLCGRSYTSRMSASILDNLNMKELIVHSIVEYEDKAIEIASNPSYLNSLKRKLAEEVMHSKIFQSKVFINELETIYANLI